MPGEDMNRLEGLSTEIPSGDPRHLEQSTNLWKMTREWGGSGKSEEQTDEQFLGNLTHKLKEEGEVIVTDVEIGRLITAGINNLVKEKGIPGVKVKNTISGFTSNKELGIHVDVGLTTLHATLGIEDNRLVGKPLGWEKRGNNGEYFWTDQTNVVKEGLVRGALGLKFKDEKNGDDMTVKQTIDRTLEDPLGELMPVLQKKMGEGYEDYSLAVSYETQDGQSVLRMRLQKELPTTVKADAPVNDMVPGTQPSAEAVLPAEQGSILKIIHGGDPSCRPPESAPLQPASEPESNLPPPEEGWFLELPRRGVLPSEQEPSVPGWLESSAQHEKILTGEELRAGTKAWTVRDFFWGTPSDNCDTESIVRIASPFEPRLVEIAGKYSKIFEREDRGSVVIQPIIVSRQMTETYKALEGMQYDMLIAIELAGGNTRPRDIALVLDPSTAERFLEMAGVETKQAELLRMIGQVTGKEFDLGELGNGVNILAPNANVELVPKSGKEAGEPTQLPPIEDEKKEKEGPREFEGEVFEAVIGGYQKELEGWNPKTIAALGRMKDDRWAKFSLLAVATDTELAALGRGLENFTIQAEDARELGTDPWDGYENTKKDLELLKRKKLLGQI